MVKQHKNADIVQYKGAFVDLHSHIDGSLSLKTIKALAKKQNISIPNDTALRSMLSVSDECEDLNEYLEKFKLPISLLQTKQALTFATRSLCNELKEQGLMYAEIRFAPQLHLEGGLSQIEVVKSVIKGMKSSSLKTNLILCCMRGDANPKENLETLYVAKMYLHKGVCAVDLAGAEALYKTKNFLDLFQLANTLGIPTTIHCGEADGCESIRAALKINPRRLGHGVRILEDETLTDEVAHKNIFFELCPTSNLNTKIFQSYNDYPVRKMLEKGLKVTINTDNRMVSNTNISAEFKHVIDGNHLNEMEVITLLKNSVDASFASKRQKKVMYKKILTSQKRRKKEWKDLMSIPM